MDRMGGRMNERLLVQRYKFGNGRYWREADTVSKGQS
jgi:hypothetical protein